MAIFIPNPSFPDVPFTPDLNIPLSSSAGQPIALLPVRLETRFFPQADGGAELRVRIYPDKIHVDTHEPGLVDQELTWGKHFWEQTWRAGNDEEAKKLAWRQLVERFGAPRAAWVARALSPLNPADRPAQPVPEPQPLPKPINFSAAGTKNDVWTRAPQTSVMPDRWHVLGYAGGRLAARAVGATIPDALHTGPDPSIAPPTAANTDDALAIDGGMKWMVDFDEAEKVGMGVRLKLNIPQAAAGLDILMVMGTKTAPNGTGASDTAEGAKRLAGLFDAHHYTDGLGFVLSGTPSNNTKDAPSGFSTNDPGEEASYLAERTTNIQPGDGSNADALATALGMRTSSGQVFANLANAKAAEQMDARHMNRALWPATWGYFLLQMMGGQVPLTLDDFNWARGHFIDYVRAIGPLPTMRVGKQPYGVLPVTSLKFWKPKAGQESQYARDIALQGLLVKLCALWRSKSSKTPRVGRGTDPDQDFAEIFGMDGISSSYAVRHLMGETYLKYMWSFLYPEDANPWWAKQQEMTLALMNRLGLTWKPALSLATYSGWFAQLKGAVTQADAPTEVAPLAPNFIEMLLNAADLDTIRKETFPEPKPKSLLYALLRHAMLQEYWTAGVNLSFRDAPAAVGLWRNRDTEIGGLIYFPGTGFSAPVSPPVGVWDLLGKPLAGVTSDPLGKFLHALRAAPASNLAPHVATLLEFRESLTWLKTLSAARLERLFAGTLDLCSHRLDAWVTSFATKRLAEMRKANSTGVQPAGIQLGGYGWVLNLKPAAAQAQETPPAGEQGPIYRAAGNPGYTHAPSLGQAATVAVLRSGHLTHSDATTKDLLSIDLSSERVRLANWLLDGVRQGQPLGALLGYRFERRLQEARLAQFISYFRAVAPLVAKKLEQTNQSTESIAANNVVDGLLLQRKWKNALASPIPAPPPGGPLLALLQQSGKTPDLNQFLQAQSALIAELNLLDDAVDAVSDALLAESVHQAAQGNPQRVAATLDAIASGATAPPELEVASTPRTGAALTYRVVSLFGGNPAATPGWPDPAQSPRASAEPHLNAWAARLLGKPVNVRCLVERFDPATGATLETKELRLNELPLTPLDCVYAADGGQDAQPSEIEQRILYMMRRKPEGFAPDAALRVNPGRGTGWSTGDLSYGEFSELRRTARQLITGARGIDASDLDQPGRNQPAGIDFAELETRAQKAEQALRQLQSDLQTLLANPAADLDALRNAILRASYFGVAGAVPLSTVGNAQADRDALVLQADSIAKELAQHVAQLATLQANFDANSTTVEVQRDYRLNRLRTVFGPSFVALPRFTAANAAELGQAWADSVKIQDNDPLAAVTWFQRATRVRDGVARLDASLRYAEAAETGERLALTLAQLPYRANDRWVGLPLKPGSPLSTSRFSLVVQSTAKLDTTQPLAGLLIDEWVEVLPNARETTAMVFQYDQPDAAPPQCVLLAVPPDLDQPWNLWSLQQVLLEALDLARLRAVDLEALDEVGHYLPALYFAANVAGDTVSTDFSTLK